MHNLASSKIKPFDPFNWYWIVAGDQTQVYSSNAQTFVPINNPAYVAWLAAGNQPTKIDTQFNLGALLGAINDNTLKPVPASVLDGYGDRQADDIVTHAAFKILFQHENRLRAIERALGLNGSPPDLTPAQAKNAVKQLMIQ